MQQMRKLASAVAAFDLSTWFDKNESKIIYCGMKCTRICTGVINIMAFVVDFSWLKS